MRKYLAVFALAAGLALSPQLKAADKALPPATVNSNIVEVSTKVLDVNYDKRILTLEGATAGNNLTIKVGTEVKNLKEIKKGDLVNVKYNESLAWVLKKHSKKEGTSKTVTNSTTIENTGNKKPEYSENQTIDIVATIQNINKEKPSVTLKGPEGNLVTLAIKDKNNLEGVKVGDQVDITYTESMAVAVEKAPKK